jgi:ATP-dependent Lon protease
MNVPTDHVDVLDLPTVERDAVSTGTAADSADWDARLKDQHWLPGYASLASDHALGSPS